jgi:hypothetical protein
MKFLYIPNVNSCQLSQNPKAVVGTSKANVVEIVIVKIWTMNGTHIT